MKNTKLNKQKKKKRHKESMELPDLSILDDDPIEPHVAPSKLRLCTVPVWFHCGYNGVSLRENKKLKINLEILFNNFVLDDKFVLIDRKNPYPSLRSIDDDIAEERIKQYAKGKRENMEKGSSFPPMFGNCVTFRYVPDNVHRISVKVFANYTLHISGCKDLNIIENLINDVFLPKIRSSSLKERIHKKNGDIFIRETSCLATPDIEYTKDTIKTAMYNTQFNTGFHIDQDELRHIVAEVNEEKPVFLPKGFHVSIIDKENYRGLSIVLENYSKTKRLNLNIFSNGSHVINGGVSCMEDVKIGYDFINNLFECHYERLVLRNKV